VGLVSQEGNICLDGYQVILLDEAYLYKAKFGVAPVPCIYIDKNNTLGLPNANKITENEYFKFPG
jgi:hypothetical protein